MIELIKLIIWVVEKLANGSKSGQPAIDPAWQAQQAEWERSRREWEARQLAAMTGGAAVPPPIVVARPPVVPAAGVPTAVAPPPTRAKSGKAAKKNARATAAAAPLLQSTPTRGQARPARVSVDGRSAREQFVLYEVLKPPLSLREPREW